MKDIPQEQELAGETLYKLFRHFADANGCFTTGWNGMQDNFKLTWVQVGAYLQKNKKEKLNV